MPTRVPALIAPPYAFAHRGARAHAPENTLEAFTLALRLGATGLESDVWLTADGDTCSRFAARPTCRSSSTASNSTSRLRSILERSVLFSILVKSYHWIQHAPPANLAP